MTSNTTYVSSIENKYKRAKLNNVIRSLSDYVDCSSPDETCQEYGLLAYEGPIYKDLVIHGDKKPKKANTPVIVSNTFLGTIDINGDLKITNDTLNEVSTDIEYGYVWNGDYDHPVSYTASPVSASCTSCYWCDNTVTCKCIYPDVQCCDEFGPYIERITCTSYFTQVHERCVFKDAYKATYPSIENVQGGISNDAGTISGHGSIPFSFWDDYSELMQVDGDVYTSAVTTCYYFSGNNLCYCFEIYYDGWISWDSTSCSGSMSLSNSQPDGINVGPFLCGFDADNAKMLWDKNPSTFTACLTLGPYVDGYSGHMDGYVYSDSGCYRLLPDSCCQLMVCMNTCRYCTVCIKQKIRDIQNNVCIHERYL